MILTVILLVVLLLSLAACKASQFLVKPDKETVQSESAAASLQTEVLTTLTDEELQDLISGTATLDQIAEKRIASSASSGSSEVDEAASDAAASSKGTSNTEAASSGAAVPESGTADSTVSSEETSSGSSSQTTVNEPAYEKEIRNLINQMYAVKSRAEAGLNSAIAEAKAEFKALPAEKQTQAKKVSICMAKTSQLRSLESSCDKEVDAIVAQMRTILTENGQSTALADQALATYKAEKSAMYATLTEKLYS